MASKSDPSPGKKRDDPSFGYPGQGGYGAFRTRDIDDAPVMDAPARDPVGEQPRAQPRARPADR